MGAVCTAVLKKEEVALGLGLGLGFGEPKVALGLGLGCSSVALLPLSEGSGTPRHIGSADGTEVPASVRAYSP